MIKAYCVNLDRKPENFKQVTEEFRGILDIERVSAIDGKAIGIYSASALHKTVMKIFAAAIKTDEKFLVVIEDDVYRSQTFNEYWPKIVEFISDSTSVWDFISLDFFLIYDNPTLSPYNDFLIKVSNTRSNGFMIYNIKFLKKYYSELQLRFPLDTTMTYDPRFIKLIPRSLMARQYVDKISETSPSKKNYGTVYKHGYNQTRLILSAYNSSVDKII
jgi:hypothetical protein